MNRLVVALPMAGLLALAAALAPAAAQTSTPNALQGFSQNRNQPVKIDAATLEVRDKDKVATFGGNVHMVQGDTTLTCKTLVVFYDQDAGATPMKTATPVAPGGGNQSIRRLEARGDVVVVQKDQKATGNNGVFDMKSNTVTLSGNVLVSQGQDAIQGDRLVVNLTTGVSRVECDNAPNRQCRVRALLNPGSGKGGNGAGPSIFPPAGGGGAAPQKPQAGQPSGLY